ncbi:putative transcription factor MYB family [Helianthus annuus]|uniref:Transcription factor MYB family n=2 Tax=Helianthus annuus TaxID=4232 RepID=A0A9K3IBK2_HELAN|nr:uncharacterized protein LOC110871890 [Helianthus annuus]KAF5793886.1 putative transcription factor MYB family [Helianthus annuus]KAJ0537619.1 putative transcription factor MYB family [Helianthus annuus]KAJ0545216.1 putative transcription factor MYB family [Helianthus annuus]KAJ0552200.1 putative transcription factor MYB family [Helianthus annuus]KAJ0717901.1 putative transcription factor MYB family [Helianthus annuus]
MGTKRPFDEELQEFIKHPKHLEYEDKPDSFGEEKPSLEPSQNVVVVGEGGETSAPLPVVTDITVREEASGPGPGPIPGFCPNLFSELFEFNLPRRPLVHYDDTYSPLLNCTPRKEVPIGPEHQADVPEFDSNSARNYISNNEREQILMGICIISNLEGETVIPETECKCVDNGSIRCVQQHVNEARLNLKQSLLLEKFVNLGFNNMGEEVSSNWTEEEEQRFQDVIYSNPVSHGKRFWEVLSSEFPTRTKKELVSYYFNVFIYRRRAVQNRSQLLAIDSDDDEWWGTKRASFGAMIEDDDDLVVVGPFVDHGDHDHDHDDDHDSSSEDGGDMVTHVKENQVMNASSSSDIRDEKVTSENELEKPAAGNSFGSKSESYLHWDPPCSTMGSTKGVDLLPTCSMIEEIFGSSKTSKST